MKAPRSQAGFTIIEVAIATTVFSVVLLLSLSAVAQIGKMYYKGVVTAQTQDISRLISSEIIQNIQLTAGKVGQVEASNPLPPLSVPPIPQVPQGSTGNFCVGDTLYSFILDVPLSNSQPHVLWADTLANCETAPPAAKIRTLTNANPNGAAGGRELLSPNMRLSKLVVKNINSTSLYAVSLGIVFGDNSVLLSTHDRCTGDYSAAQFCSVVNLDTTVKKRL
jgi:prepilin-type N-terminal cleavage/methylation domain-containing protein